MQLNGLMWITYLVYLYDVMVMGLAFEDYLKKLGEIFLKNARLKFHFRDSEIVYLLPDIPSTFNLIGFQIGNKPLVI